MHCKIINKQKENQEVIFSFDYIQLEEKRETEKREKPGQKPGQKMEQKMEQKMKDKKKEQNELKKIDIFSLNEIKISERLMNIKGWQKYTSPILYSSLVSGLGKYLFVKEKMDFSLLSFLKEKNERREKEEGTIERSIKETFVQTLSIYHSLLKVLEWTELSGIVSLSCNLNNIVFDKGKMGHVKLTDFSHSFFIGDIGKDVVDLNAFMKLIQINEFTPLGLKVLHYMNVNKCVSLSSNNIQEICSGFIDGLKRFGADLLPLDFLQEYEKKCIFSLYSFINKDKERITVELLKGSSYWDHFSMSVMFLIMLKVIDQDTDTNSNTNKFVNEFTSILLNNILNNRKNEELTFC
jgi:hypothetical protein